MRIAAAAPALLPMACFLFCSCVRTKELWSSAHLSGIKKAYCVHDVIIMPIFLVEKSN